MSLAPYASHPEQTRGRKYPEKPAPTRSDFQRDRDRIVHSTAFRRLVYKTQVFLNHEGDLFRTRLTHSLEVAQLGRSIARSLGLNEDLVETVALAHDLGHTPFGHAGQDALNACMAGHGGFEHNLQSLRVVDELEERYPAYNGLNLTFETREGILKHCSRVHAEAIEAREPNGVGHRFLHGHQPSLEAQLCNLADEIAYNAHDIDDGVRSGLLSLQQLAQIDLFERHAREVRHAHPQLGERRVLHEAIRRMLSAQIYDLIDSTQAALHASGVAHVDDVRQQAPLVCFSPAMREASLQLKRFLFDNLYRHPQVVETRKKAEQVLRDLHALYMADQRLLPADYWPEHPHVVRGRDYLSGMTDRFAIKDHKRLMGQDLFADT